MNTNHIELMEVNEEDKVRCDKGFDKGVAPDLAIVEPWPEPVDGPALLGETAEVLKRFVVLPKWTQEALALWVLHTYAYQWRDVSTYLGIESPEKRCGKTTLLSVLGELVNRPVVAANISSSAFFRVIQQTQPTLLIDEADTFLSGNDELRGILNSGYSRKTAYVWRVVHKMQSAECKVQNGASKAIKFSCWCPKAMATIGRLPDTLADRCIVIRMQRKMMEEGCARLRDLDAGPLRRKFARFVLDHGNAISTARPAMPASLNDRAADIWEPLVVLADLAGGDWPALARQAATSLSAAMQDSNIPGSLLLDLFVLFALTEWKRIFTRTVVEGLNTRFSGRPWQALTKGKPVNDIWLAKQLRPYGIRSKTIWIEDAHAKGYEPDEFKDVFKRYIPRSDFEELREEVTSRAKKKDEGEQKTE
jgi:hypothetical protein